MNSENKEKADYFKILSKNYPTFIDKYINTKDLQRLSGIGQFCGCDYTKLHNCKYWFSRLDHSIACALMAWHFTKNKAQTLSALFHDLGTPAFSHCVDYLLGDYINQETSERCIENVIKSSDEIMKLLNTDNISISELVNLEQYPVLENKKPKLCIDRLEGIFGTGLVWCQFWTLKDIEEIYENITILENEDENLEIGFTDFKICEKFFNGIYKYSMVLQQNESKFTMQFIADCIKSLIEQKVITKDMLYNISEKEIIKYIKTNEILKEKWNIFQNATKLNRSNQIPKDKYFVSVDSKKRYVDPLILDNKNVTRLSKVSNICKNTLDKYLNYKDSLYSYLNF